MKLGDTGPNVLAWQKALIARGAAIAPDGQFGPRTHNATLAFQAAHGLLVTGVVALNELQVAHSPPGSSIRPPPKLPHSIPLVPCKFYLPVERRPNRIVLHCMESAEASTTAERCAAYFATLPPDTPKAKQTSSHYMLDCDTVVQGVLDHHIAYHAAGANQTGIGLEHAGYARQSRAEWLDPFGDRMLGLSVQLAARLCRRWDIPATFLRAGDLQQKNKAGITTHREVSVAFGRSTHSDPGPGFPIAWYIERVQAFLVATQGEV